MHSRGVRSENIALIFVISRVILLRHQSRGMSVDCLIVPCVVTVNCLLLNLVDKVYYLAHMQLIFNSLLN